MLESHFDRVQKGGDLSTPPQPKELKDTTLGL